MTPTVGTRLHYVEPNPAHVHEAADRLVVLDLGRVSEMPPKDMTAPELIEYPGKWLSG